MHLILILYLPLPFKKTRECHLYYNTRFQRQGPAAIAGASLYSGVVKSTQRVYNPFHCYLLVSPACRNSSPPVTSPLAIISKMKLAIHLALFSTLTSSVLATTSGCRKAPTKIKNGEETLRLLDNYDNTKPHRFVSGLHRRDEP